MPSPASLLRLALMASLAAAALAPRESRTGAVQKPRAAPNAFGPGASPAYSASRVTGLATRAVCFPGDPSCPPPDVTITPAGGTFSTASRSVTIDWCGHAPLFSSTREIRINGVNVTASFSYATSPRAGCVAHASSAGTVTLAAGANSVWAYVEDNIGQAGSNSASLTLAGSPPPQSPVIPPPPGPPASVPPPPVPGPVVSVTDANPGANWDRDQCFTVSGGPGVAYECGDLRLAHGLPGVQTYGAARAMSLLYNSRFAAAMPVVAAYVRTPANIGTPAQVSAQLLVGVLGAPNKTVRATGTWTGSDFTAASVRRIALTYSGAAELSGVYTYVVAVTFLNSSGAIIGSATSEEGELVLVNRSTSLYGPGWWPSGVEQLVIHDAANIAWIGPDGSTRHYVKRASENVWDAGAVDRPQYLSFDGTNYIRWAPHRTRIVFNAQGQHVATINRFGRTTSFAYVGGALSQVTVPGLAGPLYQFNYVGTSTTVVAAPVNGQPRNSTIERDADGIRSICDPDGGCTNYAYVWVGSERHVQSVTDRRGTRTDFTHSAGHILRSIIRDAAATASRQYFGHVGEARGLAELGVISASTKANDHFTTAWGPRGAGDYIAAYLNRFGAPTTLTNADVTYTYLAYEDARFPGLVTKVTAQSGFVTNATYDASGHLLKTIAFNPRGNAENDTTTYTWDTSAWDELTNERLPAGETTTYDIDAATGNTNWVQVGTDPARRSTFQYNAGLLAQATIPGVSSPWIYTYDGAGNQLSARSPLGRTSFRYGDAIGRDTLVVSPIIGTDVTRTRTVYDVLSRVQSQTTTAQGQSLTVTTDYEAGGAPWRVTRTVSPDPNALGSVALAWEYDALGRQKREYEPATNMDKKNWEYDLAGNVKSEANGNGVFTVDYDALNRRTHVFLSRPNLPSEINSDEQWFTYTPNGELKTANNKFAQIGRSYYPNGALREDTLRIANGDLSTFSQHVYGLRYGYDRNGRRVSMKLPSQLAMGGDSTAYGYDPNTGDLAWVEDGARRRFNYAYTLAGQVRQLTDPTGTVELNTYNDDGELVARSETSPTLGLLHLDTLRYDLRGKMLSGSVRIPGLSQRRPVSWTYDGMGALTNNSETRAVAVNDALGNTSGGASYNNGENRDLTYTYEAGSTRQRTLRSAQGTYDVDSTRYWYNSAGAMTNAQRQIMAPYICSGWCTGFPPRVVAWDDLVQYYDGMGRLAVARRTTSNDRSGLWYLQGGYRDPNDVEVYPAFERGVDEEYRYDALGRRVWVRAKREAHCPGAHDRDSTSFCESTVERTVYDGDQVLFEIRKGAGDGNYGAAQESDDFGFDPWSLFGVVGYTHGLGIDAPVALNRSGVVAMLHRNFHGQVDQATGLDGATLEQIEWPADQFAGVLVVNPMRPGPVTWWGTLVQQKQNATGQLDMRNRNFDPHSGRFTQEDPIGLAGGMNLYGFAGGDPVNFSDPFGLRPCCPLVVVATAAAEGATIVATATTAAATVAAYAVTDVAVGGADALAGGVINAVENLSPKIHGNSLLNTRATQGYTLRDRDTGAILKYGETTMGQGRYTKKYLANNNAQMVMEANGSKKEMHAWQHEKILEYKTANDGKRPPLNKSDYD